MKFFKEWIRIPGIIAAVVLAGLVYLLLTFVSGMVLKEGVEKYGTEAVGAKVDLGSASVSLFPPSFSLGGLKITNPDSPMQNIIELNEVSAEVDLYHLVVGRMVINELNYTGLQFDTARSTSGAVEKAAEEVKDETEGPDLVDDIAAEIPDADSILAKETLLSQTLAEELSQDYARCESEWETQKSQLEGGDQYKAWGDEIKQLTSGDISSVEDAQKRFDRLKEIRDEVKAESKDIKQAKELISACKQAIADKTKALKKAPGQDMDRLDEKYFSGAQSALGNVTELLFGDDMKLYLEKAQEFYATAKPILDALSSGEEPEEPRAYGGEFVEFEEKDPHADFAIRKMLGDITLPGGRLSVMGEEINADHPVSGKPSVITIGGDKLDEVEKLEAVLLFDRRKADAAADDYELDIKQYQLSNFTLSEDSSLPLVLDRAVVDVTGSGGFTTEGLKADFVADFSNAQFLVGDEASDTVKKVFASMAGELASFKLEFSVSSKDGSFKTSLGSNLDSIIGNGLKNALKDQVNAEKNKLEAALKQQAANKLQALAKDQSWLAGAEQGLLDGDKSLKELADSALKDPMKQYQEQEKEKAKEELRAKKKAEKERAKNKLKEKFGF